MRFSQSSRSFLFRWFQAAAIFVFGIVLGGCADQKPSPPPPTGPSPAAGASDPAGKGSPEAVEPIDYSADEYAWPFFRGNSMATGVASSPLPGVKDLEIVWKYEIPKGECASPACIIKINGRLVCIVGDLDGRLLALDLETGALIWENHDLKFGFRCAPAWHDEHIYIGNIDGIFLCLDAAGKVVWQYQAGMEIDGSATFYGDWVLFTSQDSNLYVLNAQTGEEAWKIAAGDQLQTAAIVVEGHAFLAGCDGLLHTVILDEQRDDTGVELNSPTGSTPAVGGDRLYFGTQQAGFMCVDWRKKEIVWRFTDNDGLGTVSGNACLVDDRVIFADDTRRVHALRQADGEVIWQTPLRTGVFASPLVVGQLVFIGDKAGRLYALDRGTGTIVWEREFQGGFQASPAVGFGRLVIASDEGVIYCLGKRTTK